MSKKSGKSGGGDNTLRQEEEKLQAVVLLDSYSNKFEPLSSTRAECLMPMMGDKCLLDYTIEFLIDNDVKEVVLFCTRHHQQIKAYLESKPMWKQLLEVHFIYNFKCRSVGDAMREIDAAGIIRHTFILVTATSVITNIRVNEHLEVHKKTCSLDRNAVMTMLCLNKANDLPTIGSVTESAATTSQTVFVHNINNRILHYEQMSAGSIGGGGLIMPTQLLQIGYTSIKQSNALTPLAVEQANAKYKLQNQTLTRNLTADRGYQGGSIDTIVHLKTIQQRNDLLESQIYLCSPYVLHIFTDNFDYESMVEFVHGVLANEEVSGYTLYIDVLPRKYGSHLSVITSLNTYYLQVMRLLTRDDLILGGSRRRGNYKRMLDRMHVHLSKMEGGEWTTFGNNTVFERNVLVEAGCVIGEGCEFVNCYLGANCVIGDNVKLANTIVWPNSRIGSGSVIRSSLIANNVKIGNNCSILENTLICNDCLIKDDSKFVERGVYCAAAATRKDTSTSSQQLVKDMSSLNLSLGQQEDNYVKYFLTNREYGVGDDDENDDDDDFGSVDGGDQHQDDEFDDDDDEDVMNRSGGGVMAVAAGSSSTGDKKYDTSHNHHFYVIKPARVKDAASRSLANRLYQKQMSYVSNSDSDLEDDDHTAASSSDEDYDDDDEEVEEEEYYDDDDEDNENRQSKKSGTTRHREDTDIFYNEVIELLKSALKENLDPSNIILEINSRKHANGIQIDDLCYYLAKAVLHLPIDLAANTTSLSQLAYLDALKPLLKKQISVLRNYYTKTKQSQRIFLNSLLDFFIETRLDKSSSTSSPTSFLDAYLVKTLHFMFDGFDEFLSDELIIEWYEKMESNLSGPAAASGQDNLEVRKHCLSKLKPFIEWLKEDDDDDDDDEDDE